MTYRIKPLDWDTDLDGDLVTWGPTRYAILIRLGAPFAVERNSDHIGYKDLGIHGSIDQAKAAAQSDWEEALSPYLEQVQELCEGSLVEPEYIHLAEPPSVRAYLSDGAGNKQEVKLDCLPPGVFKVTNEHGQVVGLSTDRGGFWLEPGQAAELTHKVSSEQPPQSATKD